MDLFELSSYNFSVLAVSETAESPAEMTQTEMILALYVIVPLSCVGLVLNIISLWVWSAEREFRPLIFYLKTLAVCDMLFLVTFSARQIVKYAQNLPNQAEAANILFISGLFPSMIVFITSCIALMLYLTVFHPEAVQRIFTTKCIKMSMTVYFTIISCNHIAYIVIAHFDISNNADAGKWMFTTVVVCAIVPTLVQVLLIIRVIMSFPKVSSETAANVPEVSTISGASVRTYRGMSQRQVASVVCYMILFSFLAYVVFILIAGFVRQGVSGDKSQNDIYRIMVLLTMLVQIINSTVNFFIYYFLLAEFRAMLHRRLQQWLCLSKQTIIPEVFETVPTETPPSTFKPTYTFNTNKAEQTSTLQLQQTELSTPIYSLQ